jgi:hypothetical protein
MKQTTNLMAAPVWCALLSAVVQAQGTLEDYQRAERFLPNAVKHLAFEGQVTPNWIQQSSQFWYLKETPAGKDFVLFDVTQGIVRLPSIRRNWPPRFRGRPASRINPARYHLTSLSSVKAAESYCSTWGAFAGAAT